MDRRLRQFLVVAETGNVSVAAELLHVTQPTISVNLQKLEEEHGVKLFTRSSRGVRLTDFGEVLYEHVKVMARISENATAEIRQLKASQEKAIGFGTGFSWWSLFVKDVLKSFQEEHAGISVHVDVCSSLDGLRNIMIGDIAFFLGTQVPGLSENSGFKFEKLFDVRDTYFAGENHPLSGRPCTLHDLSDYPKLSVSAFGNRHIGIVDRGDLDESFVASKSRADSYVSTNSMFAGIDLIQATNAILTYPETTQAFFARHNIKRLDVQDHNAESVPIGIYSLAAKKTDEISGALLGAVRTAAEMFARSILP